MKSLPPAIVLWLPVLFPFYFVGLWTAVSYIISRTGWRTLAQHYTAQGKPNGQNFPMQSASIGLSNYNGCLSMVVAENGLYLRPWAPFQLFHPALLIPWSAFESVESEKVWWTTRWVTQVKTPGGKQVQIAVTPAIGPLLAARHEAAKLAPSPWSENSALQ